MKITIRFSLPPELLVALIIGLAALLAFGG